MILAQVRSAHRGDLVRIQRGRLASQPVALHSRALALHAGPPTCQLFLDLRAPGSPQEVDSLTDPILPPGLQLVSIAPKHQVAQGPRGGLLDILVGATEEVHQLADASQLVDLQEELPHCMVDG